MFAMVTHPEVVQQCQVEIDAVIGQNRLPDFTDRPNLPTVMAVIKEVLRYVGLSSSSLTSACLR